MNEPLVILDAPKAAPPIPATQAKPELLESLKNNRPYKIVDVPYGPGRDQEPKRVRMRPLTGEEQQVCAMAAEAQAKKQAKTETKDGLGYERLFADQFRLEVLYRACSEVEQSDPHFTGRSYMITHWAPALMKQVLTADEIDALFRHYLTVRSELGPFRDSIPDDELEDWITRIAADGSAFAFDLLGPEAQRSILLYMAFQLRAASPAPTDTSTTQ